MKNRCCKSRLRRKRYSFVRGLFHRIKDKQVRRAWTRFDKEFAAMNQKYGDASLENDDIRFVWGVRGADDLSGTDASLYSMNDIDITYDKKKQVYVLGVETAYMFESHEAASRYLHGCLNAFTQYMQENGLDTNQSYDLFMRSPCTTLSAVTIEELYVNFRVFVFGFQMGGC